MPDVLGDLEASERLVTDLYIDLRHRINKWASITKQTAQARMGYVGQHLVSIATGYPGGRSGARGRDLIITPTEYGEIKTCYRVDQLGKCNECGAVVAAIEQKCPECESSNLKRNDDSKWLISIRNEEEYAAIIEPKHYYFVLFDFTELNNPHTIRASIWEVNPRSPGFAYCMIDYFENIRSKSTSRASFNLWPFQMKFDLMYPKLIYRSYIFSDGSIDTKIFPGRDTPQNQVQADLSSYSRARNLDISKLNDFGNRLRYDGLRFRNVREGLGILKRFIENNGIGTKKALDTLAKSIYWPGIQEKIETLPKELRRDLGDCGLI